MCGWFIWRFNVINMHASTLTYYGYSVCLYIVVYSIHVMLNMWKHATRTMSIRWIVLIHANNVKLIHMQIYSLHPHTHTERWKEKKRNRATELRKRTKLQRNSWRKIFCTKTCSIVANFLLLCQKKFSLILSAQTKLR